MSYSKQTWDTNSYVNPTRMNHMEDGIKANSDAIDAVNKYENLLTSANDLNNVTTPGHYTFAAGSLPTNRPSDAPAISGTLTVEYQSGGSTYIQTYETYPSGTPYIYKRRYVSGSWGSWNRIALNPGVSTTFVSYGTTSPVTIPNITQYRYITVGYCISNQTRFFDLCTLPTEVFKNRSINVIYSGNETEITYNNDTSVNVRFNSNLQWPIMIILS